MIDPLLSAALSVRNSPSAILVGSGLSRSAGIPTGWEVLESLIRLIAQARGADVGRAPATWFEVEFGTPPTYSGVVEALAPAPADRQALLRDFFEPNEEEREQGIKVPTPAHRAIASMVSSGFIKAIVTTNFDRLLERAVQEAGVEPVVISTPAQAIGAPPLSQVRCMIVKAHGDYLDSDILNTATELATYHRAMARLLRRVFMEFGLIVSGWSAEWDTAMRDALGAAATSRLPTYWTARGDLGEEAQRLVALRHATVLPVTGADGFFTALFERIESLAELERQHPVASRVAAATVKRLIPERDNTIRLHDYVQEEVTVAVEALGEESFSRSEDASTTEQLRQVFTRRVRQYEAATETLQRILAAGCFWGEQYHERTWVEALERIANSRDDGDGHVRWLDLMRYPGLLLAYVGGVAAVAGGRYSTLAALSGARMRERTNREMPAAARLNTSWVATEVDPGHVLEGMQGQVHAFSLWLERTIREPLREVVRDDVDFQRAYDRFEYIYGLAGMDMREQLGYPVWIPLGQYAWRGWDNQGRRVIEVLDEELGEADESYPPLRAGLFGGSIDRMREVKALADEMITNARRTLG